MDSSHYYHTLTIVTTLIGLCYGVGILTDLHNGAVEGNVTLSTTLLPPEQPHDSITWSINGTHILTHRKDGPTHFSPGYENRVTLDNSTGSLELRSLTMTDSGQYAVNILPATGPTLVGNTELRVLERVAGVSVSSSSPTVIERMSVNLTCAASGSISTREWMKDGVPLSPSDRISFSGDKTTVSINPVNRNDKGVYLCHVSNPVSSQGAEYDMIVYYGPDKVTIKGPLELEDGQKLTLTCLTDSNPTARYSWTVNGTIQPEDSHVFTIEKVQYKDSGTYNCTASNTITGYSEHAVHTLEVKAVGSLSGLSGGAIAGIVFAVLVLVAVSAGLTVYFIKKKDLFKNTSSNGRSTSDRVGHSNGGGQAASEQDLNYADLSHFQKKDGGFVQFGVSTPRLPPTADSTEYSDVRLNTKPPSRTAAIQNSQAKRPPPSLPVPAPQSDVRTGPAPQSGLAPSSIYSEVQKK